MGSGGRRVVPAAVVAAALALPAGAVASPYVHAHRGGPLATKGGDQRAAFPENTMPAFRAAAAKGFVLELDVNVTSDRVPVVIHDSELDRTTDCEGLVGEHTLAEVSRCEVDVVGIGDKTVELPAGDRRRARVPTLARVLRFAKRRRAEVNLEVKNIPTDAGFDPGIPPRFAEDVAAAVKRSGYPPSLLIVQSFWPLNLDVFRSDPYFASAELSFLTLAALNAGGPAYAKANGYDWVSPAWPVDAAYIAEAHALGLRVVPYTLDDRSDVNAATRAGVDAVISNDPGMTRDVVAAVGPPRPRIPPPPNPSDCRGIEPDSAKPSIRATGSARHGIRVFAMQFKQELAHVATYRAFRTRIECQIMRRVVPRLSRRHPNVIAFNEDIGLMTLATGPRGALARQIFGDPDLAPSCEPQGVPCGTLGALGAVTAGYADQIAAYQARFPDQQPVASAFLAATDTFARGWMQVFSDMARRYDLYILGSNNQAPFRESTDPTEIALISGPGGQSPESVFVATEPAVYNEVFMWGPHDIRREGPWQLRNVVVSNKKIPLTPIEETLQLTNGPATGPDARLNLAPYRIPGTRARIGFATSKPAFEYGHGFGEGLGGVGPCADVYITYMPCLEALGTNVVMQDEANSGRWSGQSAEGNWTPLEWMRSTWRSSADPATPGFLYNVTPHLVGNLADLPFDGQTAITQRGLRGDRRCTYVGDAKFQPDAPESDAEYLRPYARRKREFLALVPWLSDSASRDELREVGASLAPGSGSALENEYIETAIVADLSFPPVADRRNCIGSR